MMPRVMGELRIEVPQSAAALVAMAAMSASLSPMGVSHEALPRTSSHPCRSSSRCVSALLSAGAKMKTFGGAMSYFPPAVSQL
jgi:hypothetical protein